MKDYGQMRTGRNPVSAMGSRPVAAILALCLVVFGQGSVRAAEASKELAVVSPFGARLRPAAKLQMPHEVDCNSPSHWDGEMLHVFISTGQPYRSTGKDLFHLGAAQAVQFDNKVNGGRWIEATCRADDGTLYGWYHNEPGGLCPGTSLTAPKIGAVRSSDNGATWKDLGIVLEAPALPLRCDAKNGYFAGGHGDFSVMLDAEKKRLCLFYSNYTGDVSEQGVAVARMEWSERDKPTGKVFKYRESGFGEPGLGGKATPIFPGFIAWEREDCNAFWGPSLHWNTHLKQYVMLLNRSKAKGWVQDGIYISFASKLDAPNAWSKPQKLFEGGSWYPLAVGLEAHGTDKVAGRVARFFMSQTSEWEIVFSLPGEK